jgi:hypothetical protein
MNVKVIDKIKEFLKKQQLVKKRCAFGGKLVKKTKVVKTLKPLIITDYTAINFVRLVKNLDPLKNVSEYAVVKGGISQFSASDKFKYFLKYVEETAVNGIFSVSRDKIAEDLGITEPVARNLRNKAVKFGLIEKIGNSYKVNNKVFKEWRQSNG